MATSTHGSWKAVLLHLRGWLLMLFLMAWLLLLLGTMIYIPVATRRANLAGCRQLGLVPYPPDTSSGLPDVPMDSPDGRYLVSIYQPIGRGCAYMNVTYCNTRRRSARIGCDGIFPPESPNYVRPVGWQSEERFEFTIQGTPQSIYLPDLFPQQTVMDQTPPRIASVAAWSPDGEWFLASDTVDYHAYTQTIYRVKADGSLIENLTPFVNAFDRFISWMPDGELLFASDRDGMVELYRLDLNTLTAHRSTYSLTTDIWLGWEANRQWGWIYHQYAGVYRLNPKTAEQQLLPIEVNISDFLGLTADGSRLLTYYRQQNIYDTRPHGLYWIDTATFQSELLTPLNANSTFVAWSPDRKTFLATHWRPEKSDEIVFERFGQLGRRQELLHSIRSTRLRSWSSNSRWLIFEVDDGTVAPSSYLLIDLLNPAPQLMTVTHLNTIHWSPDGEWMFYTANGTLYRMRLDSSEQQVIMALPEGFQLYTFSPDSQWFYYGDYHAENNSRSYYRRRLDGTDLQVLPLVIQ